MLTHPWEQGRLDIGVSRAVERVAPPRKLAAYFYERAPAPPRGQHLRELDEHLDDPPLLNSSCVVGPVPFA